MVASAATVSVWVMVAVLNAPNCSIAAKPVTTVNIGLGDGSQVTASRTLDAGNSIDGVATILELIDRGR